mmetsp:Transcript_11566/g.32817  ORF Transcript_11566/g.32817 Transcript_11566/m.32817 type:complete len:222 (+) Transcript_11566:866-1531(+)
MMIATIVIARMILPEAPSTRAMTTTTTTTTTSPNLLPTNLLIFGFAIPTPSASAAITASRTKSATIPRASSPTVIASAVTSAATTTGMAARIQVIPTTTSPLTPKIPMTQKTPTMVSATRRARRPSGVVPIPRTAASMPAARASSVPMIAPASRILTTTYLPSPSPSPSPRIPTMASSFAILTPSASVATIASTRNAIVSTVSLPIAIANAVTSAAMPTMV